MRTASVTSLKAGLDATTIALILGMMAAFAVARYTFFGREAISLLVILPIALPGIVTGIALNSAFTTFLKPFGIGFGLFTVIVGHATFCIVVAYNNVLARLRRVGATLEEASGASINVVAPVSSWPLPSLSGSVSVSPMAWLRVARSSPILFPEWQGLP